MDTQELYEKYAHTLYGSGIKAGLCPADAEELVSETFARAIQKGGTRTRNLLLLIHNGLLVDTLRGRGRSGPLRPERPIGLDVELRDGQRYVGASTALSEDEQVFVGELTAALQRCRPEDARIFAMHYINGLTYDEIGQRLGLSRQRVHQRAERARLRIIEEVAV